MHGESSHVYVDLAELRDIGSAMRDDTDQGLRPGLATTGGQTQQGIRFGQNSPSGEVDAAHSALTSALTRYEENGDRHLRSAEALTTALDQILRRYAATDALSAVAVSAVEAELNAAFLRTSPGPTS